MAKILCTLPNASGEISGVKFVSHKNGMLSEEIDDQVAAVFLQIPGYELVGAPSEAEKGAAEAAAEAAAKAAEDAKADLVARAAAIDFKVKAVWGVDRLKAEVEAAEKAAAEAKAAKTE